MPVFPKARLKGKMPQAQKTSPSHGAGASRTGNRSTPGLYRAAGSLCLLIGCPSTSRLACRELIGDFRNLAPPRDAGCTNEALPAPLRNAVLASSRARGFHVPLCPVELCEDGAALPRSPALWCQVKGSCQRLPEHPRALQSTQSVHLGTANC